MRKVYILIFILLLTNSFAQYKKSTVDSLTKVISSRSHDTIKVQAYIALSSISVQQAEFDKAIKYARDGFNLSKKITYRKGMAQAANNLASAYYSVGNYPEALTSFSLSANIKEQMGDVKGMARTVGNIGAIYSQQGNYAKALEYYYKSLALFEKSNDLTGMNAPLNNIGLIYYNYRDYKKAGKIFRRLLSHYNSNKLPKTNTYVMAAVNMALINKKEKNYEATIKLLYEAMHWAKKLEMPASEALAEDNLGTVLAELKQYDSALIHLDRALTISERSGDKVHAAVTLVNKAHIYSDRKLFTEAEKFALQSLKISEEIEAFAAISESSQLLSEIYTSKNDFRKALDYHKKFIAARDSIYNEENTKKSVAAEMNFEFEKKEAAAKALMDKEREVSLAEKKRQRTIIISVSIGLILLLMLAAVIFYNLQQNKKKNKIISAQKKEVEEKNKEITDSINYAKRIQEVMLPCIDIPVDILKDAFILFKPKDVVSGDFYWYTKKNNRVLITAADCTGHGVPGALMSMIGNAFLNETVNEKGITDTTEILGQLRDKIKNSLRQKGEVGESKDGMDMALISFNEQFTELQFSGAHNPLWIFSGENVSESFREIAPDKRPVGYYLGRGLPFSSQNVQLKPGDTLYIFTDGFADQFGGEKGKKFKTKNLRELLARIQPLSMQAQKRELEKTFLDWKGAYEQVDDICLIGIRIPPNQ